MKPNTSRLGWVRSCMAIATLAVASAAAPAMSSATLKPFNADYQASYMGLQGNGHMTLVPSGANRWKYTLDIRSTMATLSQSTTFEDAHGQWRPLSVNDSSLLLIKKISRNATYDWNSGQARWSGDVKADRSGPVALQPGDMNGMLINLAIARDVQAGKPLTYRMVDDGRAKQLAYQVSGKETITIEGKAQQATKVTRVDGDRETVVWVVDGLPVPARILQRKGGSDELDLRLTAMH